jgi:hypothetical protein
VRAGLAAVEDRGLLGLDGDDLHAGLALLEHLADAGDGAAGADAGDDDVDRAVGVAPDLLGRGLSVDLGVGGVGELRAMTAPSGSATISSALATAPFMPLAPSVSTSSAPSPQQGAALLAHRLGHGQDEAVAAGRAHEGQGDAGVARGGLDDGAAGLQLTGGLGASIMATPMRSLTEAPGVEELELQQDGRPGPAASMIRLIRTSGVLPNIAATLAVAATVGPVAVALAIAAGAVSTALTAAEVATTGAVATAAVSAATGGGVGGFDDDVASAILATAFGADAFDFLEAVVDELAFGGAHGREGDLASGACGAVCGGACFALEAHELLFAVAFDVEHGVGEVLVLGEEAADDDVLEGVEGGALFADEDGGFGDFESDDDDVAEADGLGLAAGCEALDEALGEFLGAG